MSGFPLTCIVCDGKGCEFCPRTSISLRDNRLEYPNEDDKHDLSDDGQAYLEGRNDD